MEIHYKSIVHERTEDAPFVGALISAIDCNYRCRGCFNTPLKRMKTLVSTAKEIIDEVLSNPFNEGIILGGLEWSLQPLEMLELCNVASKSNLKIMIYTGADLEEFYSIVGKAARLKTSQVDMVGAMDALDTKNLEVYTGRALCDFYIPSTHYIKTGKFIKSKKSDDNVAFGVRLASENQMIYQIKKAVEAKKK